MYLLWSNELAHLSIKPPAGEHVNEAAPASISVADTVIRGHGDLSGARFPVNAGDFVRVEIPLCKDNNTECRVFSASAEVSAVPKGKVPLLSLSPINGANPPPGVAIRIYDFGAEWCPPCQLMAAEVLHDPADAPLLAGFDLVPIDADAAASWALKSQYGVGAYPTLVAVDSLGDEVDRFLGYPSEAALQAWLAALPATTPLAALRAGPAPATQPPHAAETALRFARLGEADAAQAWLAVASPDLAATYQARLLVEPSPGHVDWLLANAADGEWLYDAVVAFPARFPALAPRVARLPAGLAAASMAAYADSVAENEPAVALVARAGALSLTWSQVTSDDAHNRGLVLDLADLLAATGDFDGAVSLLDKYVELYPDEFTWDFMAARLYSEHQDLTTAEKRGRVALAKADGDQRLRAVTRLGAILADQGRVAEAIPLLEAELAVPAPPIELEVRTHRYRKEAESALAEAKIVIKAAGSGTSRSP